MSTTVTTQTYIQQGIYTIIWKGEFDETNVDAQFEIIHNFLDPLDERKYVLFDLTEVDYVNSKFIGFVASISNQLEEHGGRLILVGTEKIRDTLEICGIHQIIEIFDDMTSGKKYFVDSYGDFLKQKEADMQKKAQEQMRENAMQDISKTSFFDEGSSPSADPVIVMDPLQAADDEDGVGEMQAEEVSPEASMTIAPMETNPSPESEKQAEFPWDNLGIFGSATEAQEEVLEPSVTRPETPEVQAWGDLFSHIWSWASKDTPEVSPAEQEVVSEKEEVNESSSLGFFWSDEKSSEETGSINLQQEDVSQEAQDISASSETEDSPLFWSAEAQTNSQVETPSQEGSEAASGSEFSFFDTDESQVTEGQEQEQEVSYEKEWDSESLLGWETNKSELKEEVQQEITSDDSMLSPEPEQQEIASPEAPAQEGIGLWSFEVSESTPEEMNQPTVESIDQELESIKSQIEALQSQGKELYRKRAELLSNNS